MGSMTPGETITYAVANGRVDIVRAARPRCSAIDVDHFMEASARGDLSMMECLADYHFTDFLCPWLISRGAIHNGHTHILDWILTLGRAKRSDRDPVWPDSDPVWPDKNTYYAAIGSKTLDAIKWLTAHDCPVPDDAFAHAATGGNVSVMRWFHTQKMIPSASTCTWAAIAGSLDALKWLRDLNTGHGATPWEEAITISINCDATREWALKNGGTSAGPLSVVFP